MAGIGWLTRSLVDVPSSDAWLGPSEREALAGLHLPRRRADWRLGRWAAKSALAVSTGRQLDRIEVVAARDGAPEARVDSEPTRIGLSISHRAGRALAVVGGGSGGVGCDLELVEPRSDAFMADWLAPEERELIDTARNSDRARLANLVWTAKEAAAKLRREGLRLDVRRAVANLDGAPALADGEWRPLVVRWEGEGVATGGWWREEPGWVFAVAAEPRLGRPVRL